jgi:hypothetical protein
VLDRAFGGGDTTACLDLHKTLYLMYELSFGNPLAPAVQHEHAPWLLQLRASIERTWMDWDLSCIADLVPSDAALASPEAVRDWLVDVSRQESPDDRIATRYLAERADLEDFKKFLLADSYLNYRFYDAIALSQLHYCESVKAELSRHMYDECGCGNSDNAHTRLFSRALMSLGLDCPVIPQWEDWRPYAGFNLYFLFGLNRRHYFKALGSLAMPELFDPDRDRAVVAGCRRLGLDADRDFVYYTAHIETDEEHGVRWLDYVIMPVVRAQPGAAREIVIGAALRMEYMRRYNQYLLDVFGLSTRGAAA